MLLFDFQKPGRLTTVIYISPDWGNKFVSSYSGRVDRMPRLSNYQILTEEQALALFNLCGSEGNELVEFPV